MSKVLVGDLSPNSSAYPQFNTRKHGEKGAALLGFSLIAVIFIISLVSVMAFLSPNQVGDYAFNRDSKSSGAVAPFMTGDFAALTYYGGQAVLRGPAVINTLMQRDLKFFAINSDSSYDYCLTLLEWNGNSAQIIAPYHYQYDPSAADELAPCSAPGLNTHAANEAFSVFANLQSMGADMSYRIMAVAHVPERKLAYIKFVDVEQTSEINQGSTITLVSNPSLPPMPPTTINPDPEPINIIDDTEDIIQIIDDGNYDDSFDQNQDYNDQQQVFNQDDNLDRLPDDMMGRFGDRTPDDLAYDGGDSGNYQAAEPPAVDYGARFPAGDLYGNQFDPYMRPEDSYSFDQGPMYPPDSFGAEIPDFGLDQGLPPDFSQGIVLVPNTPTSSLNGDSGVITGSRYDMGQPAFDQTPSYQDQPAFGPQMPLNADRVR